MTLLDDRPDELLVDDAPPPPQRPVRRGAATVCASAALAAAAFGWVAGSAFAGPLGRGLGVGAALVGGAAAWLAARSARPATGQWAGAAVVLVLAAAVVLPDTSETASLPALVLEALRSGGLAQPPVPLDPGWRFLLVALTGLLALGSASLAVALDKPRAATGAALPLVVGASLLLPSGAEVAGTLVGLLLLLGSLAVSLGADLASEGSTNGRFELRRLARSAAALVALGALLGGTAQLGFLFPEAAEEQVVPPRRPEVPPPAPDRVLFAVDSERPLTWRLGTLDVYRDGAWMTPPFDPARLVDVDGAVPLDAPGETRGEVSDGERVTARFELRDPVGKSLPSLPGVLSVEGAPAAQYDPRTQALRTGGTRLRSGTTYTVTAVAPPTGAELSRATGEPGPELAEFLEAPPAPSEVTALLEQVPEQPYARLQAVRRAFYANVVAAGAGEPVDVSADRVVELLAGREGTPYEIAAAEGLLARWAGIPARLGYGWSGGDERDGVVEVRPRHGATWLEAWFDGHGWVPVVGTPPRARTSFSTADQNSDPSVQPSDELALVVYVPVRLRTVELLYVYARHWALVALPFVVAAAALVALVPVAAKSLRRVRRRRAGRRAGHAGRIAAAYAELRDTATDLGIGHAAMPPLELLDAVEDDAEHRELAWLVTRALWGDLARDLTEDDAVAAEELSRSVARRLRTAQPGWTRVTALVSRASLVEPWTRELPTCWPARGQRAKPARRRRPLAVRLRAAADVRRWPRRAAAAVWPVRPVPVALGLVLATAVGAAAVGRDAERDLPSGPALPSRLAPAAVGDVRLQPEPEAEQAFARRSASSLAEEGRVFSLRQGDVVQGSLQVTGFVPEVDARSRRVRDEVLAGLGRGRFEPGRIGEERVFRITLPEQRLLLAFTPDGRAYYLLVARAQFRDAEEVFAAVLAHSRGEEPGGTPPVPRPDPRRGSAT